MLDGLLTIGGMLLGALLLGGGIWWGIGFVTRREAAALQARALEEATRQQALADELARVERDRCALAIRLVSRPHDRALFRMQLMDQGLRSVQIIGESLSLIASSKNPNTRRSRLELIQDLRVELEQQQWDGLAPEAQAAVRAAADFGRQLNQVKAMGDEVQKHLRAAERAVKPETRTRYMALAREAVTGCMPGVTDPDLVADVKRIAAALQEVIE